MLSGESKFRGDQADMSSGPSSDMLAAIRRCSFGGKVLRPPRSFMQVLAAVLWSWVDLKSAWDA